MQKMRQICPQFVPFVPDFVPFVPDPLSPDTTGKTNDMKKDQGDKLKCTFSLDTSEETTFRGQICPHSVYLYIESKKEKE